MLLELLAALQLATASSPAPSFSVAATVRAAPAVAGAFTGAGAPGVSLAGRATRAGAAGSGARRGPGAARRAARDTNSAAGGREYDGRSHQLTVAVPRIDAQVHIDGVLDEPVWQQAAVLSGFSQYAPVDGLPAPDPTEVLVWYSPTAIYFGIRAHEPHGAVHATLADRDQISGDDYVQVLLDTFHDGRRAYVFGVNPLGVQSDGIRSEGGGNAGHAGGDFSGLDLSPDFIYESKGRVTPDGYVVEMRIPFKSIRYQSAAVQSWGINIIRQVQHSGYQLTWTPARRASSSFLAQSGTLEGLTGLRRGLVMDLNPVATTKVEGAPSPTTVGAWRYAATPEVGGNLRWGVTPNLTLSGTANPDFSQVEADADQVVTDPRQALFYAEKRPFFLEGIEQFQTPDQLVYTRRIVSPRGAVKLTGNADGTDIGFLSAVDEVTGDAGGLQHPVFNILRLRRNFGGRSTAGLVYTDRTDGGAFNRVLGADARVYFKRYYYAEFSVAGSATRDSAGAGVRAAPLWHATLDCTGRNFGCHYELEGIDPNFVADAGYISRTGIVRGSLMNRFTAYGAPGATLENYTLFAQLQGTWLYPRFVGGHGADDIALSLRHTFTLRGGWSIGLNQTLGSDAFPAQIFATTAVVHPSATGGDTVPLSGGRIRNLDLEASVTSPSWKHFSGSASFTGGRDDNFDEWAPAWLELAQLSAFWHPTERVRVTPSFIYQRYLRTSDGSTVRVRRVPRLKVEYQLTRAIFLRFVGQYDSQWRDALRDDSRSGDPLVARDGTGAWQPLGVWSSNSFRHDWLFSYQPTPGTVFFAGYGSSLGADSFTLRDMQRQSDGFFFKVSYLFRM